MHEPCLEVLLVHGNEVRLFWVTAIPGHSSPYLVINVVHNFKAAVGTFFEPSYGDIHLQGNVQMQKENICNSY